jgi:flagellar motility protein MotE (MotC chaperone)
MEYKMKLTKQILAKLIKEEYNSFLTEDDVQRISYKALFDLEKKLTSDIKKQEKELNKKTDAYNKLEDRLKSTLERLEEERNDLYSKRQTIIKTNRDSFTTK